MTEYVYLLGLAPGATFLRRSTAKTLSSRQPVGEECGPCRNANILLSILAHIGNGIRVSHLRRFHAPQFFPRLCIEGAEHAVQRRSDKREPSRRRHRAT